MTVGLRKFLRHFPRYCDLAERGQRLDLVDRKGKRFVFVAEKPRSFVGAGKHLSKGKLVSPEPVPRSEWKGLY